MEPREAYNTGELTACLRLTDRSVGMSERVYRIRALIRLSRYREALTVVGATRGAKLEHEALLRALESTCHSFLGATDQARRALDRIRAEPQGEEARFEVAYARMLLGWVEGTPDAMEAALHAVDVSSSPHLYGRWLYASSWVPALRGEYHEQMRLLELSIRHIAQTPEAYDVTLLASATRSLVHLVREIAAPSTFDFAVRITETLPWTEDLEGERFLTFRGLAWAYALRGSHEKALQYAYFARDIAPSVRWVAACYADQAYLARMAGENASADALLRHAVACARETDWSSPGEERVAILNLIELAADRDLPAASRLMDIYDAIPMMLSPALALGRDRRLHAMEEYARGCILAASGHRAAALQLLASAYTFYRSIDYAWRAAAVALRLHEVSGEHTWLRLASEVVAAFSESSVARDIRLRAGLVGDPRVAALTPAQHRVYALICEGLSDKEIAQNLRISPETVKNHAARIRLTFGVRSRAALIAAVRQQAV
ncbi:MAG: helix-turn-helix transcriptional regulator [Candidatus Cybelea sp.]